MQEIRMGVIGCGRWGSNFIRALGGLEGCRLLGVHDSDARSAKRAARGNLKAFGSPEKMVHALKLDAVIIATPATVHHDVAMKMLKSGVHVLVEKPLAVTVEECTEMTALAARKKLTFMVGHIFHYNKGVVKLKSIIDAGELGELRYLYSVRTNLGPIRSDVNVLWDLAAHDVSMMLHLVGESPQEVTASGQSYLRRDIADVGFGTLYFAKRKILGHLQVSWLDPHKVRKLTVIGADQMAEFDDVNTQEPIRLFNRGVLQDKIYDDFGHFQMVLRDGDINIPHVALDEPLRQECLHFLDCVRNGKRPLTDGRHGTEVVRVLAALDTSLKRKGAPVKVG